MAGKAPSRRKDKPHNSRPYDRPNQGLLGKVASKVKDLLTPSWLFSVQSWIKTEEVEGRNPSERTENDDFSENDDDSTEKLTISKPRLPIRSSKRPRYESNNINDISPNAADSFWLGPSTSQSVPVDDVDSERISPIIPNCDDRKNEAQILINGDDHSENSDNSASTSGCSSLISSQEKPHRSSGLKLNDSALDQLREELNRKSNFKSSRADASLSADMFSSSISSLKQNSSRLWSCSTQTPPKLFPQRTSSSNRPAFNISSFGKPSVLTSPQNMKIASPFYDGNTTFGGASAYRRKLLSTPYQIDSTVRSQLKVKEKAAAGDFDCMSSAARRILHTLERMSTPITDAKRIPNSPQSPLSNSLTVNPPSQRLRACLSTPRTPTTLPRAPPIVNLKAVSKVPLLKNRHSKTKNSMMLFPIESNPLSVLPEECTVNVKPSNDSNFKCSSGGNGGGGKMRAKVSQTMHSSSKSKGNLKEEANIDCNLPHIPLPVTSLPKFHFNSNKLYDEKLPTQEEVQFKFSEPLTKLPASKILPAEKDSSLDSSICSFQFSKPLDTKTSSVVKLNKKSEETTQKNLVLNKSVDDVLKSMREASEKSISAASKETTESSTKSHVSHSGFGDKFKPKPGCWECSSCLLQNSPSAQKCIACETPHETAKKEVVSDKNAEKKTSLDKDSMKTIQASPLSTKLSQIPQNTWTCDTCWVSNPMSSTRCLACETLKPSADEKSTNSSTTFKFGMNFEKPSFKFGCETTSVPTSVNNNVKLTVTSNNVFENAQSKTNSEITFSSTGFKLDIPSSSDKKLNITPASVFGENKIATETPSKIDHATVPNFSSSETSHKISSPTEPSQFQTSTLPSGLFGNVNTHSAQNLTTVKSSNGPSLAFSFAAPTTSVPSNSSQNTTNVIESVPKQNQSNFNNAPFKVQPSLPHSEPGDSKTGAVSSSTVNTPLSSLPAVPSSKSSVVSESSPFQSSISTGFAFKSITPNSTQIPCLTTSSTTVSTSNTVPFFTSVSTATPFSSTFPQTTTTPNSALFKFSSPFSQVETANTKPEGKEISDNTKNPFFSISQTAATTSINQPNFATSGFNFTAPVSVTSTGTTFASTTTTTASSSSLFNFGNQITPSSMTFQPPQVAISTPATSTSVPNSSILTTFTTTTTSSTEPRPAVTSGFPFKPIEKTSFTPQHNTLSTFGSGPTQSGIFQFGNAAVSQPSGNFGFTSKADFGFESGSKTSTFNNFQPTQTMPATGTSSLTNFSFNNPTASAFKPQTGFNFNAKSNLQPQNSSIVPSPVFGSSTIQSPVFGANASVPTFGTNESTSTFGSAPAALKPSQPTFGASESASTFGGAPAGLKPQPSGGFNFSAAATMPFGAPTEKKPMGNTSGFNFMPTQTDGNSSFAPSFNINTPPSFNFGATSTPNNQPFQFAATGEPSSAQTLPQSGRRIRKGVRRVGLRKD